jgi:hypothetical protein
VAVGDFNGDGKLDLAVANYTSGDVTILLGDGSGGFTEAAGSPVRVGANPVSVAVGDFNGDGKPDLAVANSISDNVTILLGDGTGGFSQPAGSPLGLGGEPSSVAVGDFNGDGKPDLAVANLNSNNVTILLGDGSGGFINALGSPVGAGNGPFSVAVGDFNGDGKLDLAVANFNEGSSAGNVTILLGDGSGGFTEAAGSPVGVGFEVPSVAVGDFNGDGQPDLAVANEGQFDNNCGCFVYGNVTILLGDGSGSFSQPAGSPVSAGSGPDSVAVGDFNGDGKPDLAVANYSSGNVTILINNTCHRPPVALCRNVTTNADAGCEANIGIADVDNGSFDSDGDPFVLSLSPSGPYGLGSTSVTLTVMDNHGASNSCSATVTVNDTTAPSVTCPGNISTNIPSGQTAAVVNYPPPTASDNCSAPAVVCDPPSGSSFPLGVTNVTCTATDGSDNTGTCSFTVTVNGSVEGLTIAQLIEQVQATDLGSGLKNALIVKLHAAQASLGRDRDNAAVNQIEAFIHQVRALERTGRLDETTAEALIAAARTIIGSI